MPPPDCRDGDPRAPQRCDGLAVAPGRRFSVFKYIPETTLPPVGCCWLGGRKGIRPVKTEWWGAGMVICLERVADLHTAQLMPLSLTVSCFSKIQIGFAFLIPAHPRHRKRAAKRVCVCVCVPETTYFSTYSKFCVPQHIGRVEGCALAKNSSICVVTGVRRSTWST